MLPFTSLSNRTGCLKAAHCYYVLLLCYVCGSITVVSMVFQCFCSCKCLCVFFWETISHLRARPVCALFVPVLLVPSRGHGKRMLLSEVFCVNSRGGVVRVQRGWLHGCWGFRANVFCTRMLCLHKYSRPFVLTLLVFSVTSQTPGQIPRRPQQCTCGLSSGH